MKKNKLAIIIASLAFPASAIAADLPWLTFRMADGTELSVAADNLSINYKDGNLILSSSTVEKILSVDQINSMRFTASSAGVEDVTDIQPAAGEYYDLSGIKVGRFSSVDEAREALPSGVYVVRSGEVTFKVSL